MDRLLVLVRHGQSEWNLQNLFTGWKDPGLTEQGVAEARAAGRKLQEGGYRFDVTYTSALSRAQDTLDLMLAELGLAVSCEGASRFFGAACLADFFCFVADPAACSPAASSRMPGAKYFAIA